MLGFVKWNSGIILLSCECGRSLNPLLFREVCICRNSTIILIVFFMYDYGIVMSISELSLIKGRNL